MPEPVAELIVREAKRRLSLYTTTHRSARVASWQPKDLTIHIFQGELIRNDELSCPGNPPSQAWDMQLIVAGLVKPSDSEPTPVDTFKNRFWAEIVKAATDAPLWHQWDGNAINTLVGDVEDYTSDDGSVSGVKVTFDVTFRTDETNPFNVRA